MMNIGRRRHWTIRLWLGLLIGLLAMPAWAQVDVTIDGDTALATISLTDGGGITYDAEVTIVFDHPVNLTADNLNITAELVDPNDPDFQDRLPAGVSLPDAFPMMITVEPPSLPWLFQSGFEDGEDGAGNLQFLNTYQFEVHTHDLEYTPNSPYRLFKAPIGGNFADITNDIQQGSMRARGRGPAFSQFVVVSDSRLPLTVALAKIVDLNTTILAAIISDGLRGDLLGLLAQVDALVVIGLLGPAIDVLDQLIGVIDDHAGTDIANVWRAQRDLVNDAGQMDTAAYTLRFSLSRSLLQQNP